MDKVISKIQKLLSMANDDAIGGEHERDTAMKMALNLLAKHNLSMSDLETDKEEREVDTLEQYTCPWRRQVANAIAQMYFTAFFSTKINGKQKLKFNFIGLQSNCQTAKSMTEYVIKSLTKEVVKLRKELNESASFETSFFNGAAIKIVERCRKLREEAELESKGASSGTAMVLASLYDQEKTANNKYIQDEMNIKLTMKSSRLANHNTSGFNAGKEFGSNLNLSKQLGSDSKKANLKIS
jgi:hypothetical protein